MTAAWIGLGANLGDARSAFDAALSQLDAHPQISVLARSGLYQTAPVGQLAGNAFLNAVCRVETSLAPLEMLDVLQSIEKQLGRQRGIPWGPRTLDLDLLFFGEQLIESPRLTVPHPGAWYRRFVLDPLIEIAPDLKHPLFQVSLSELRDRLQARPLYIRLAPHWTALCETARDQIAAQFPSITLTADDSSCEPEGRATRSLRLRLLSDDWQATADAASPCPFSQLVADLTASPGEPLEKVIDFLTALHDEPQRLGGDQ